MSVQHEPIEVDHSPASTSSRIAVAAAALAALFTAPFALLSAPFAVMGAGLVAGGLFVLESRLPVTVGVVSLFGAIVIAGGYGVPAEVLLPAMIATMVAWDVGNNGISVGEQMGRQSPTQRAELFHAAATTLFGVIAGGLGYAAFSLGASRQPAPALVLLLFGAVFLAWALRK